MLLTDPIPGIFTYAAWRVKPPRLLTTRPHPARDALIHQVQALLATLDSAGTNVRLFEATAIAPVPGRPVNDVIALVDSPADLTEPLRQGAQDAGIPPTLVLRATNAARFGNTDAHDGPILLNHFVGNASTAQAVQAWTTISTWYSNTIGVDNSTLLQFEPGAPFVIANYVAIPTSVPRFMAAQLLRPSFYTNVARPLARVGLRPYPVFARRVEPTSTS